MSGLSMEMSDAAFGALFGSGGFLLAVATNWISQRNKSKSPAPTQTPTQTPTPTLDDCKASHLKNEVEHNEIFNRLRAVETKGAVSEAVVARIDKSLDEINKKIDDLAR